MTPDKCPSMHFTGISTLLSLLCVCFFSLYLQRYSLLSTTYIHTFYDTGIEVRLTYSYDSLLRLHGIVTRGRVANPECWIH